MANELSTSLFFSASTGIFKESPNHLFNKSLTAIMDSSFSVNVTGADILDISMEAYSSFSYSESTSVMGENEIYEQLKSMDPELAEKYSAIRRLLSSISGESAEALDRSMRNIFMENQNIEPGDSFKLEAAQTLKVDLTLQNDEGEVFDVSISLSGSISITSGQMQEKDPILVDMDGNGIHFDNHKQFDIDEDGEHEAVRWVSDNDGVLFLDIDKNGKASDITELFGDINGFSNGVEMLLSFDENSDSNINSLDSIFNELMIETGSGSVFSMADLDVKNISINGEQISLQTEDKQYNGGDYNFQYLEV